MTLLKNVEIIEKNSLYYIADQGKKKNVKPWLGDLLSPLYDRLMEKVVFPKKLYGDIHQHFKILQDELCVIENSRILELGTGSGNAIQFLDRQNQYIGIDVSPGLLKQAHRRLTKAGFTNFSLYVTSAELLPFQDEQFDVCLCFLSLNFFSDIDGVIQDIKRLLVPVGSFICCVPVPERNVSNAEIRGTLYTEHELKNRFEKAGFKFQSCEYSNGALLYFKAWR